MPSVKVRMEKGNKSSDKGNKSSSTAKRSLDASYAKWDAYFRSDSKQMAKDLNVTFGKPLTEEEFLKLKQGSQEKFTVLGR